MKTVSIRKHLIGKNRFDSRVFEIHVEEISDR
jgi:hypothetical protein